MLGADNSKQIIQYTVHIIIHEQDTNKAPTHTIVSHGTTFFYFQTMHLAFLKVFGLYETWLM